MIYKLIIKPVLPSIIFFASGLLIVTAMYWAFPTSQVNEVLTTMLGVLLCVLSPALLSVWWIIRQHAPKACPHYGEVTIRGDGTRVNRKEEPALFCNICMKCYCPVFIQKSPPQRMYIPSIEELEQAGRERLAASEPLRAAEEAKYAKFEAWLKERMATATPSPHLRDRTSPPG